MTNDLLKIILFGGTLEELNNFTREQYKIGQYKVAGEFFKSPCWAQKNFLEKECKEQLKELGYDGIIHRQDYEVEVYFAYITGVPVKLINGKK